MLSRTCVLGVVFLLAAFCFQLVGNAQTEVVLVERQELKLKDDTVVTHVMMSNDGSFWHRGVSIGDLDEHFKILSNGTGHFSIVVSVSVPEKTSLSEVTESVARIKAALTNCLNDESSATIYLTEPLMGGIEVLEKNDKPLNDDCDGEQHSDSTAQVQDYALTLFWTRFFGN